MIDVPGGGNGAGLAKSDGHDAGLFSQSALHHNHQ